MMFKGGLFMSLYTLDHPPCLTGNACRKRLHCRTRPNSSVALQLSAVLVSDASGNSFESKKFRISSGNSLKRCQSSGCLLSQENTIGVIGGVSVLSTLIFLEKLACWSSRDGKQYLPFVVCSDPALSKQLSICSPILSESIRNAQIQLNKGPVIENLRHKRNFLQQSGAQCLVMPCHLCHAWHGEVSEECSVPFLHVGDCVALELKKAKLRPIDAASTVLIGVLTTDEILVASYYQEKLQSQGFEVALLDKATKEHTLVPAMEALKRKDIEGARNLLRIAIHVLLVRAVNVVILASDDLLGLLPHNDPILKKCINPMDALARSTIQWAESKDTVHEKD